MSYKRAEENDNYVLLIIVIVYLVGVVLFGISEFVGLILAWDGAALLAVIEVEKRVKSRIEENENMPIVELDSPKNWLMMWSIFSFLSLISGFAYIFLNALNIITEIPIISNSHLLIFTMGFFILNLIFVLRTAVFVIKPDSKTNLFVGNVIYRLLDILFKVCFLSSVVVFQYINFEMLSLVINNSVLPQIISEPISIIYGFTIVLSFFGGVFFIEKVIFHPKEKMTRWDWVFTSFFALPWVTISIIGTLLRLGITLV